MKSPSKIYLLIVTLLIVVLGFMAHGFGLFYPINNILEHSPDFECTSDDDCKLWAHPEWSQCSSCGDCGTYELTSDDVIAINAAWQPTCPVPRPAFFVCGDCISTIHSPDYGRINADPGSTQPTEFAKCINSQCQKVIP